VSRMYTDVIGRLKSFGCLVLDTDQWALEYLIAKVTNEIKNECNISGIPEGLHHIAIDMVCGEFMQMKKGTGQLDDLDVEATLKQIHEGDTTITYAVADKSITLDGLIEYLINGQRSQFITYRRVSW